MIYTKKLAKNGRTLHYKNGRLCSKVEYEANAVPDTKEEVSVEDKLKATEGHKCIFCGGPGHKTKWINAEVVRLCDSDYYEHTTGEIAEQMRKLG